VECSVLFLDSPVVAVEFEVLPPVELVVVAPSVYYLQQVVALLVEEYSVLPQVVEFAVSSPAESVAVVPLVYCPRQVVELQVVEHLVSFLGLPAVVVFVAVVAFAVLPPAELVVVAQPVYYPPPVVEFQVSVVGQVYFQR